MERGRVEGCVETGGDRDLPAPAAFEHVRHDITGTRLGLQLGKELLGIGTPVGELDERIFLAERRSQRPQHLIDDRRRIRERPVPRGSRPRSASARDPLPDNWRCRSRFLPARHRRTERPRVTAIAAPAHAARAAKPTAYVPPNSLERDDTSSPVHSVAHARSRRGRAKASRIGMELGTSLRLGTESSVSAAGLRSLHTGLSNAQVFAGGSEPRAAYADHGRLNGAPRFAAFIDRPNPPDWAAGRAALAPRTR